MKAYVITIDGNEISEKGSAACIKSSWDCGNEFTVETFEASTPDVVDEQLKQYSIEWDYPWVGEVLDFRSGLKKSAYRTQNPKARIACALSHYRLWKKSLTEMEDILVLEHDSLFLKKLDFNKILDSNYGIIGINDPRGATRRASVFHAAIQQSKNDVLHVPKIDVHNVPQGLAGNSAYIIKPWAADMLLELVKSYGLWPNDAIMCYQLLPHLGVTKQYYTRIQGLKSTTT